MNEGRFSSRGGSRYYGAESRFNVKQKITPFSVLVLLTLIIVFFMLSSCANGNYYIQAKRGYCIDGSELIGSFTDKRDDVDKDICNTQKRPEHRLM